MTPGEKVALRALAMERQSTMSEVLRIALRGYLQSNAPGAPAMGDLDDARRLQGHCRRFGRGCGVLQEGGTCVCTCASCVK